MHRESTSPGEWEYLTGFRTRETQPASNDEVVYTSLRRRLLVEGDNGIWRLRVPLMARWLRQPGGAGGLLCYLLSGVREKPVTPRPVRLSQPFSAPPPSASRASDVKSQAVAWPQDD
jgi:hypothetical protein